MKKRPIVILVCIYIVFLIWILVWQPKLGERIFRWNEKEERLKEHYAERTEFEGLVLEVYSKNESGRARILLEEAGSAEKVECILIYDEVSQGSIQVGSYIKVWGEMWWPEAATNPGEWDGKQYARIDEIDFYIRSSGWEYLDINGKLWLKIMGGIRQWFSKQIQNCWQNKSAEIIKAMLLGESEALDENTTELFRKGGISHVIAISGLHLTIISDLLGEFLKRFQKPKAVQLEVNGFLWIYALLTGASVSTMRATIMVSIRTVAVLTEREEDPLTTLALTAGILLIKQPLYILDAGFALSFAALLGMKYGKILFMSVRVVPYRIRRYMASSVAISLATMPISLWFFYETSVYGFVLNFWVVPAMELVLVGAMAAIGLSWIHPAMGKGMAAVVNALLYSFQKGSDVVSQWPGAMVRGKPELWQMMVIYGLWILIVWHYRKPKERARGIQIMAVGLLLSLVMGYRANFWRIMYLDVGQGDCAVIEWNKKVFLVDAGPNYESVLKPYLMMRGIRTIDGVLLSHADWDHIEGLLLLSEDEDFVIKGLWIADDAASDNENRNRLEQNISDSGGQIHCVKAGYCFQTDGFKLEILAPVDQQAEANEGSLVAKVNIEGWDFLFPGDIGEETEKKLSKVWSDVDVLKTAHHGSKYSTSKEFLEMVQPEIAVISCGRNNRYGHPHEDTVDRMEACQVDYYVTAESGAIWIEAVKDQLAVRQYVFQ